MDQQKKKQKHHKKQNRSWRKQPKSALKKHNNDVQVQEQTSTVNALSNHVVTSTLDVVLSEWFKTTTLLTPITSLVAMCLPNLQARVSDETVIKLRVEAFGSGEVIAPRFDVNINKTTTGELYDRVAQYFADDDQGFRLICGKTEIDNFKDKTSLSLVTDVFDIVDGDVIFVVVVPLQPRECLMRVFTEGTRNRFGFGWGTKAPLSNWMGVLLHKESNKEEVRVLNLKCRGLKGR